MDDLTTWRNTGGATKGTIPSSRITASEWNFAVGKAANLFEQLGKMPVKLGDVTDRIFQGIKTSADKIYIVEEIERKARCVKIFSREKEAEYWFEPDLLHPPDKRGRQQTLLSLSD